MIRTSLSTYSGPEFLLFYAAAIAAAVVAGLLISRQLRPEGNSAKVRDALELAWLGGGGPRVVDTVLAGLLAKGAIAHAGAATLRTTGIAGGHSEAERAVLDVGSPFKLAEARAALLPIIAGTEKRLVAAGLAMTGPDRLQLRILSTLPFVPVIALGLYRRAAGIAEGEPVENLTVLLVVTTVAALVRFCVLDKRTVAGKEAVAEASDDAARLRSAPTQDEMALGVALFGTTILVGTPFAELHAMRKQSSGDAGSSDGGGCGGSGCGGCGGCGG